MSSLDLDPPTSTQDHHDDDLDDLDDDLQESQVDQLIRLWRNERSSPELLPHNSSLLDSLVSLVAQQSAAIEPLRSNSDSAPSSSSTKTHLDPLDYFRLTIVQLDLDRINWLLRALVRCRLYKIEKFAHYLLQEPSERLKLSALELEYAESYKSLLDQYYHTHVLAGLPEQLQFTTNPQDENDEMLVRPNFDDPVFARVRRSGSSAVLADGRIINLRKGSTHLLRYNSVRRLLDIGVVELV